MATVGPDQRLTYYQQTAEAVIAELGSHRQGLTSPEADRRLAQHGLNTLDFTASAAALRLLARQLGSWPVLSLLLAAGLSGYLSGTAVAGCFLAIALLVTMAGLWQAGRTDSLEYHVARLLPATALVSRGSLQKSVPRSHLVLGDIVHLSAGDRVPADLRLIEVDQLATDESAFNGNHDHLHKYTHAISAQLPLGSRHNMVWLGSRVASGTATGIVVATGLHSELGRLMTLSRTALATKRLPRLPLSRRLLTGAGLLAIVVLVAAISGQLSADLTLSWLIILATATASSGWRLGQAWLTGRARRSLRRHAITIQPSTLRQAGRFDLALLDIPDFVRQPELSVSSFLIGKQLYRTRGEAYSPVGTLSSERGGRLTKKVIHEQELFFVASALSHNAKLLPADAEHASWHPAGDPASAALLTLAARAGYDSESLRAEHPLLAALPADHHRQRGSLLRGYGQRTLAFVEGDATTLLPLISRLWDGGHTRAVSDRERQRLSRHIDEQLAGGSRVIALAYRPLTKAQLAESTAASVEQDLVLLGLVALDQIHHNQQPLARLLQAGIKLHLLADQPVSQLAALAQRLELPALTQIRQSDMQLLTETQLGELLAGGPTIWTGLSADDRLRLVDIGRRFQHRVLVSGRSLQDVPALIHADVGLASRTSAAAVYDEASLQITSYDLSGLWRARRVSRQYASLLQRLSAASLIDAVAVLWMAALGVGLQLMWHLPPLLSPLLALALLSLCQVLVNLSATPSSRRRLPVHHYALGYGALAAILAAANFWLCFTRAGLRPNFISADNPLALTAVTLSFVTLLGCMLVNAWLTVGQRPRPSLWLGWLTAGVLLIIYLPAAQSLIGSRPLSVIDWICALLAVCCYAAIRWLLRHNHRHSRQAVIQLHHEVHGSGAGAKI